MGGFNSALFLLGLAAEAGVVIQPVYLCATPAIYPALSGTTNSYPKMTGTETAYPALNGTPGLVECD